MQVGQSSQGWNQERPIASSSVSALIKNQEVTRATRRGSAHHFSPHMCHGL